MANNFLSLVPVWLLLIVLAAAAIEHAQDDSEVEIQWRAFLTKYEKIYTTAEEAAFRRQVFAQSLERVAQYNMLEEEAPFGVTKFSDLTVDEFRSLYLMSKHLLGEQKHNPSAREASYPTWQDGPVPTAFDWRSRPGVVTPVKDQGQCGSCWAFSATENIESVWALQGNHTLTPLSVQQIVSCDTKDEGCNGGDTPTAYQYVMKAGGLETEVNYPYKSGGGATGKCKVNVTDVVAKIDGFEYATKSKNETAMQAYLYNKGPLSVCVDAETWQDYNGGIVKSKCGAALDHCVMITGYNVKGSTPYWIVRNSWATSWGEAGYIYIERDLDLCGIAKEATSAYISSPA